MNQPLFMARISALRARLRASDADSIWIVQPENRRYLSGFRADDVQLDESSGSLLITENRLLLLTDSRYTEEASGEAVGFEINTLKNGLADHLSDLLPELGARRLGFEKDYVTWGLHQDLEERLLTRDPTASLVPLDGWVEMLREIKDASEMEALQASADLLCRIMGEIVSFMKPGMTEREVAWKVETLTREGGAEDVAFPPIVASGPNGALPHAVPTQRRLEKGEPIVLDLGVRLNGYCSDMTRTVFLGEPSPEFKTVYRTVRTAQQAAIREIRPGLQSTYVDGIARDLIKGAGYGAYFGHSLGHGVGLATHEGPRLAPRKPVTLKAGMVTTVEPGIYLPGKGGVRIEDMALLTEEGSTLFTTDRHLYDF